MANAYQTAQQLGLTGTDAEIVSQLRAVTARPIDLAYLMELLNFRGMLRKTDGSQGQEKWIGTLQNLKAALASLNLTDAVSNYEMWFSHVTNPRQVKWDTTLPRFATGFAEMEANFAGQEGMPTVEDFAAVAELGGGHPFADLTESEYAQQRTAAQAENAKNAVRQEATTLINESVVPAITTGVRATIVTAFRESADTLENS